MADFGDICSMLPSPFVGVFEREGYGAWHQARVRSDGPDVPGALSTGAVCRSSISEMAQAALTSPIWLKAWGKVAQELSADGIDLLRQQADVADEGGGPAKTVRA